MKRLTLLCFPILFATSFAIAGPRVGNGGGAWVCQERNGAYRSIQVIDLFEAEHEYGLALATFPTGDPWVMLRERYSFIVAQVPSLARELTLDPAPLQASVQILPKSTALTRIDDDQIRVKPAPTSCVDGTLFYGQFANYTFDGRLLIAGDLWLSPVLSDQGRAALLLHELVYKTLRDRDGDINSSRARAIVGILFSQATAAWMDQRIELLLASPELGRDPPAPRPLPLSCFAHIESETNPTVPGPIVRLLADPSGSLMAALERFSFHVSTNASMEPTELLIVDEVTGVRTVSDEIAIGESFRKNGHVSLSLELGEEQRIVALECRGSPAH